jgi:Mg-chelatase subunit ChlD
MRFEVRRTQVKSQTTALAVVLATVAGALATLGAQQSPADQGDSFRFKSGVELINVTATVTDASGRFVPGLRREDFVVYEDGEPQTVTHFSAERVPVSLGIVIDTSGSMQGEKMSAARSALDRFLYELLDRDDEIFVYRFSGLRERSAVSRPTAVRRCTTAWPRRFRWPSPADIAKRPSS